MEVIKEKRGRRSRQARHAPRHGPYADRPHLRPRASSGSWRTSPSRDGSRRPHGRPDAPLAPRRARRRRHAYRWAAGHAGTRASGEANAQPYDTRSSKYLTCFELLFYLAHAKHQCEILAVSVWICQQAPLLSRAVAVRFPPRGPLMPRTGIRPGRRMRPTAQNMAAPQPSIQITPINRSILFYTFRKFVTCAYVSFYSSRFESGSPVHAPFAVKHNVRVHYAVNTACKMGAHLVWTRNAPRGLLARRALPLP